MKPSDIPGYSKEVGFAVHRLVDPAEIGVAIGRALDEQ